MSNFKYVRIGEDVYLWLGDRLLVPWKERWVPTSEKIIEDYEPDVEGTELELSIFDDVDEHTMELNSVNFSIDEHTLVIR